MWAVGHIMLFLSVLLWGSKRVDVASREMIEEQWLQWWDSQLDDGSDYLEILETKTTEELIAMMAIGRKS